jgi:hypothetical protein
VLSGYDLLALLSDPIEIAVESNTKPPVAVADGPYASLPHLNVAMSAAGSADPDGDALSFAWTFGDGSGATGQAVSHVYANAGTFTVRLIVTDVLGLADTALTTAVIATPQHGVADAQNKLLQLVAAGGLSASDGKWHASKLDNAVKLLDQATFTAAVNQLEEVLRKLDRAGMTSSDYAETVRELIRSLTS